MNEKMRKNVTCPFCGYRMPIRYDADAECKGLFVKCKGRQCRRTFEIKIERFK